MAGALFGNLPAGAISPAILKLVKAGITPLVFSALKVVLRTRPVLAGAPPQQQETPPQAPLRPSRDNRLKHAPGDRPNSEFIIDPKGVIVRKRAGSHPGQVRKDLEELVGKVEKITREEDVKLNIQLPLKVPAARGVVPRIQRPRMQAIEMQPVIKPKEPPFDAKLRIEAAPDLLRRARASSTSASTWTRSTGRTATTLRRRSSMR